jgi:hypothetical protein
LYTFISSPMRATCPAIIIIIIIQRLPNFTSCAHL